MNDQVKKVLDLLLQTRKARETDGARITIKRPADEITQYTDIFVWESEIPNEDHFTIDIVVQSMVNISAVIEALKSAGISYVVATFISEPNYDLALSRPLTGLVHGTSKLQLHEFYTNRLSWQFFDKLVAVETCWVWQSLTALTLDISVDTLEDQACCMDVLLKGNLRRFLSQLRMLQHLSLSFYSALLGHEVLCSHAPLNISWKHRHLG